MKVLIPCRLCMYTDDVNEIKQDISAFRCELLEVLKNSGMNTTSVTGLGQGMHCFDGILSLPCAHSRCVVLDLEKGITAAPVTLRNFTFSSRIDNRFSIAFSTMGDLTCLGLRDFSFCAI